jgi:hypothetical protein
VVDQGIVRLLLDQIGGSLRPDIENVQRGAIWDVLTSPGRKIIDNVDAMPVLNERIRNVRSNKSSPSCNQNVHVFGIEW